MKKHVPHGGEEKYPLLILESCYHLNLFGIELSLHMSSNVLEPRQVSFRGPDQNGRIRRAKCTSSLYLRYTSLWLRFTIDRIVGSSFIFKGLSIFVCVIFTWSGLDREAPNTL